MASLHIISRFSKELTYLVIIKRSWKLKVQACKLYNNKYGILSIRVTKTEIFAFIAAKLLSRKVLLISIKDNRNC